MRKNFPESDSAKIFLQESNSKMRIAVNRKNRFENKKWRSSADFKEANHAGESIRGDSAFFEFGTKLKIFSWAGLGEGTKGLLIYMSCTERGLGILSGGESAHIERLTGLAD